MIARFGIALRLPLLIGIAAACVCLPGKHLTAGDYGTLWASTGIALPEGLTNVAAVSSDNSRVVILQENGAVRIFSIFSVPVTELPPADLTNLTAVAAGYDRVISLHTNGTVREWVPGQLFGSYLSGVPADLTNAVAIAPGYKFGMALRANGTLTLWGTNSYVTNLPPSLTDIAAIAAGHSHALVLRSNGNVSVWGQNQFGQTNLPSGLSNITLIAAASNVCMAANAQGEVWRWGERSAFPLPQKNWGELSQIGLSTFRTMLLLKNGSVYGWRVSTSSNVTVAFPPYLTNVLGIAVGDSTLAVTRGPLLRLQPATATNTLVAGTYWALKSYANARPPFGYQWFHDGSAIPGANDAMLRFIGLRPADSGNYSVTVSNTFGSITSTQATLNVAPLTMSTPEFNQNSARLLGRDSILLVSPQSIAPASYQWFHNGSAIAGATNSSLRFVLQMSHGGTYSVFASNIYGTVWTSNFNLTIAGPAFSVDDSYAIKPAEASGKISFPVRLRSSEWTNAFSLNYVTMDDTARRNVDYVHVSGTITFPPGATNALIDVPLLVTTNQTPRRFELCVGPYPPTCVTGWIISPSVMPQLTLFSTDAYEGTGTNVAQVSGRLLSPGSTFVTFQWATRDGTARAGRDYVPSAGSVTLTPGTTNQTFSIPLRGDLFKGSNRVFYVDALNVAGAIITNREVKVTILEDDTVSIAPGFTQEIVTDQLSQPTSMAFAPDGRLFCCEQDGRVRLIKDGTLLRTPFLRIATINSSESGLLGIAFDPGFVTNQFIYFYYKVPEPDLHNRVSRFTANGDTALVGSEQVILEIDSKPDDYNHQGGAIHFGPDGKLYIAVGEHGVRTNIHALTNHFGKILRLNPDGTIPEDNPFYSVASGTYRSAWALGLRNPFTFAIHARTGRMLINDVGDSWEEINEGQAGANYGWPFVEGQSQSYKNPLLTYRTYPGYAVIAAAFYDTGRRLPAVYQDNYFYGDLSGGYIRRMMPDGTVQPFVTDGLRSMVDLDFGPEDSLYCLVRNGTFGAKVYRFAPGSRFTALHRFPDNRVRLQAIGVPQIAQVLEASSDLEEWTAIATNNPATHELEFFDSDPAPIQRFYRLTEP